VSEIKTNLLPIDKIITNISMNSDRQLALHTESSRQADIAVYFDWRLVELFLTPIFKNCDKFNLFNLQAF